MNLSKAGCILVCVTLYAQEGTIRVIRRVSAPASITFGTPITCITAVSSSPATCSATIPGGTHVGMLASIGFEASGGTNPISSATFDSVAPSSTISYGPDGCGCGTTGAAMALWINPSTGSSKTFSVTFSGSVTVSVQLIPVYGINQTGTRGTSWRDQGSGTDFHTASGNSATISNAIVSVSGDVVADNVSSFGSSITVGGSQTQDFNTHPGLSSLFQGGSHITASGSTTTMTWTLSSTFWGSIGISLIPG